MPLAEFREEYGSSIEKVLLANISERLQVICTARPCMIFSCAYGIIPLQGIQPIVRLIHVPVQTAVHFRTDAHRRRRRWSCSTWVQGLEIRRAQPGFQGQPRQHRRRRRRR